MLAIRDLPSHDSLFPLSQGVSSWSTSNKVKGSLKLAKSTLNPKKVAKDLPIIVTEAPNQKQALNITYPKGSYKLDSEPRGGISFYSQGPSGFDLTSAKEATFAYAVYFPNEFDFVKGGKLPGLYGGNSEDEATTCSGGRDDSNCFSGRLMWRKDGEGEVYAYVPLSNHEGFESNGLLCNFTTSHCDASALSLGRGNFQFPTGAWTTVAERIRLNDPDQANGEIELFVDGKSVINTGGIKIRDTDASRIRGIQVQSFFGGSTEDWASSKDQEIYLADFSVAITEDLDGRTTPSGSEPNARLGWKSVFISALLLSTVAW